MTTLDRYIARQYFFNVCVLLVLLFSFVIAVDVALNMNKFLEGADRISPHADSVRRIALAGLGVFQFWWPRLLQLYCYLIGLILVAAMGFTFTQLVRHRELVAALAGGISLYRVMVPVLAVALAMLGLKVVDQEFILSHPKVSPLLTRDQGDFGQRDWSEFPVRLARDAQDRIFLARSFDPGKGEMTDLTVWFRTGGQAQYAVSSPRAVWRDGGWDLTDAKVQSMQLGSGGTSVAGSAVAAPDRIETDLDPNALKFKRFRVFSQSLSWGQIGEMLDRPRVEPELRAELQRARWSRVSQGIGAMLALLITMPFFLMREPKNMLIQSLKCAPVGIISLMGGILMSTVKWPLLPPGFAVFIPVLILTSLAIAAVSSLKT